jgi:alpha-L-fucosidase
MVRTMLPLLLGALVLARVAAAQEYTPQPRGYAIAPGPFTPAMESLQSGYRCPEWFRDAKLGIWAHWGPQSVPMAGDWYARNLYLPGQRQYQHHLQNYGHPSKTGYKDLIPLWKAEKWDPDRLMALYKKAGARYFVSMGVHHDNFDLWNSTYHRWNAVNMGPRRDVVGTWQKAAKRQGLRFGVSEHLGASFTWFQPSHGADRSGPEAGVSYDGADPRYAELYHLPARPGDTGWYSTDPQWHQEWFNRIKDLVDQYQPDLLYTDGGVPFGNEVGRSLIAHLYNASAARHGGRVEAVYTCKQPSEGRWVEDLERGVMPGIRPYPWQTDTSIGDWFYNKDWKYRGADWVIHSLVDIVSKNGNLLINVVQRPDGSLDPEAEEVLEHMARWMGTNGESIYGTRPWLVHGEGPVRAKGGHFSEDFAYSARDLRFTRKGDRTLYVTALGWPEDGKLVVRSLAKLPGVIGAVTRVSLLGHSGKLDWVHDTGGLTVRLPQQPPSEYAVVLKVICRNLEGFKPELAVPPVAAVQADAAGAYLLKADDAETHGTLHTETRGGVSNVGFWDNAADWLSWKVSVKRPGRYRIIASIATPNAGAALSAEAAGHAAVAPVPATGSWDVFTEVELGDLNVGQAGEQSIALRPGSAQRWKPLNLRWVKLAPR